MFLIGFVEGDYWVVVFLLFGKPGLLADVVLRGKESAKSKS